MSDIAQNMVNAAQRKDVDAFNTNFSTAMIDHVATALEKEKMEVAGGVFAPSVDAEEGSKD
jgi:hypothetical protein